MLPLPYLYYRYSVPPTFLHSSYLYHRYFGLCKYTYITCTHCQYTTLCNIHINVHVPMPAFISFNHIQRTWFVSSLRCTNNEFKVNSREIISASDCHLDLHTLGCKNMQEREAWNQCRELIIWQVHSDSTTLTETMDLHCTYQLCSLGCRHICHSY